MNDTPTLTAARHVAFMDIGTNAIRLLFVRINPNYSTNVLTQLKQTVRLGEGSPTSSCSPRPSTAPCPSASRSLR